MTYTALAGLLFASSVAAASLPFQVKEDQIQIVLRDNATALRLPIQNPSGRSLTVSLELEWLTPSGEVVASQKRELSVPMGESQPVVAAPLPATCSSDAIWYRLRYRLSSEGAEGGGTLSLAHSANHVFELRVSAPRNGRPGAAFGVHASTRHPISGAPVEGVALHASLDIENREVEARAVSDESGTAILNFDIPDNAGDESARLEFEAVLGDFHQSLETDVTLHRAAQIRIDTDKPLYQPGQTLHTRLLVLQPSGRAAAGLPLTIRIEDPEQIGAHMSHVITNRFGVASADWQIPSNARLGDYALGVESDRGDMSATAARNIKISRYDPPDFTVTVKPDRPYYLPGENAVVEVRTDYLFGKPVPGGHVRVVRETRRHWNYRLQRWDIEEGDSRQGTADSSGRFVANLDLSTLHGELADNKRTRYEDATFTAHVRDPVSGRTEQRRFDLRITKDPIHLYLIRSSDHGSAYVSASYADGRPAVCRVHIDERMAVTTNSYGVARVVIPYDAVSVNLTAEDGRGLKGRLEEGTIRWGSDTPKLRVETDKTLYRPGEPIHVAVYSSKPISGVALEVLIDDKLLSSKWLDLSSGLARVELPWRDAFVHEVTIGVALGDRYGEAASKTVLFPANRELNVSVRTEKPSYRPGEEATASFVALSPDGKPVEAALGVAVVDTAIEERVRTDSESRRSFSSWWWFDAGLGELAGFTRQDLYRLDVSKPIPADLDLLAEAMLSQDRYWPSVEQSSDFREESPSKYSWVFADQFRAVRDLLARKYANGYHHPKDLEALKKDSHEAGLNLDEILDPWEQPFRAVFETSGRFDRAILLSAGPDKRFGTEDDLTALRIEREYFKPHRDRIDAALKALPAYPSTETGVRSVLQASGIRLGELRDPWGTAYSTRFEISRDQSVLSFHSAGPDRTSGTSDDIQVDNISGRYFTETQSRVSKIIDAQPSFPSDERAWNQVLRSAGLFPLRDTWGTRVYPVFHNTFRYTDLQRYYIAAKYGSKPQQRTETIPATESLHALHVRSAGPDREVATSDDFELASFSRTVKVETNDKSGAQTRRIRIAPNKNTGSIIGRVIDPSGAVIAKATVRVTRSISRTSAIELVTQSDESGLYLIGGLPLGTYEVRMESPGFQRFVVTDVPVSRRKATVVDATLNVGTVSETVTVEAPAVQLQTVSASMSAQSASPQSTPRVREYFPETLLWAPALETDADGRAQVKFRLADNITTWKLEAIASTETGEIGTAAIDIRAFQPFFIDHAPPRVLTQGDKIQVSTSVRNYLEEDQTVGVALRPEDWFEVIGGNARELRIASGASANAVFLIQANSVVTDGKQRITAQGAGSADAIEKPVTVHPDGREISSTLNAMMTTSTDLEIQVPDNIVGSALAELKVYPNVMAHVIDGIEGIQRRPYGCAEQTISSSYPSLMLLQYFQRFGVQDPLLHAKATRYLQSGLDRLLGYRGEDGSFSYWGRGDGDVTLTAYALSFLMQAKVFAVVDNDLIEQAQEWLIEKQGPDGEWLAHTYGHEIDARRTLNQTAQAAIALTSVDAAGPVTRALSCLLATAGNIDDPYLIAAAALIAKSARQPAAVEEMLSRLRRLARRENHLVYWNVETNTPFHGWGMAGRLETTALALQALASAGADSDRQLIDDGLLFLLRNKDRHGVWHSTQATVKVLEAILSANGDQSNGDSARSLEVMVNGVPATSIPMPGADELTGPVSVDMSQFLRQSLNRITVRRSQGGGPAFVQLATAYYVPWNSEPSSTRNDTLRYRVTFDKTEARPGDAINCRVEAERVGFHGYGMMVAEIGLPPGVDVDRRSLDDAMEATGHELSRCDILPDRVLAYLWPTAGGTSFTFRFRPRVAMEAKSAASVLYDYYNPEAQAVVQPVRFRVESAKAADRRPRTPGSSASRH